MLKNSIIYILASLVGQGSYFVTTYIVIRYLNKEEFGEVELFYTYSQFGLYLLGLNFYTSITKYKYEKGIEKSRLNSYTGNLIIFGILVNVLLYLILLLGDSIVFNILSLKNKNVLYLLPSSILLMYLMGIIQNYFTVNKEPIKFAFIQFFNGFYKVLAIYVVIIIFTMTNSFSKLFAEYFVLSFITLISCLIYFYKDFNISEFRKDISYAFNFSSPLILYVFGVNLLNFSDQWIISSKIGVNELGVYSVSYRYAFILMIFYSAIANFFSVDFYDKIKSIKLSYRNNNILQAVLFLFSIFLVVVKYIFMPIITDWNVSELEIAYGLIDIIILSYYIFFYFYLWSRLLFYYKKNLYLGLIMLSGACVNLTLNSLFVPKYGIIGAAYITLFSMFIITILSFIFHIKLFKGTKEENIKPSALNHLIYTVILILACYLI